MQENLQRTFETHLMKGDALFSVETKKWTATDVNYGVDACTRLHSLETLDVFQCMMSAKNRSYTKNLPDREGKLELTSVAVHCLIEIENSASLYTR